MAPTTGHHQYAPPHPYQQNAFGILGEDNEDNEDTVVATQVAALTYQSQLMQTTAANTSQCQEQQMALLSAGHDATHATLHQLIDGMNALALNVGYAGRGKYIERGYGGRGRSLDACRAVVVALRHTSVESPKARVFPRRVFLPPWAALAAPWAHCMVSQDDFKVATPVVLHCTVTPRQYMEDTVLQVGMECPPVIPACPHEHKKTSCMYEFVHTNLYTLICI
jgi:hypothetical protein